MRLIEHPVQIGVGDLIAWQSRCVLSPLILLQLDNRQAELPIPKSRLEAIPWTRFTVQAQAQLEKKTAPCETAGWALWAPLMPSA